MRQKHAVRGKRRPGFSLPGRIWMVAAIATLILVGGALGLQQRSIASPSSGGASGSGLTAERTSFDFGRIGMTAGLVKTNFPLTVQGSPLITGLMTS